MRLSTFDQQDFFLPNGPALENARRIVKLFGNEKYYRVHQQMDLYPALDVIIRRKSSTNDTNMLNSEVLDEVHRLNDRIQSYQIEERNYSSLCARFHRACMIDGNYLLSKMFRNQIEQLPYPSRGIYTDSTDGANGISSFIFGKDFRVINVTEEEPDYEDEEEEPMKSTSAPRMKEIVSYVRLFRLRYALDVSTDELRRLAMAWERGVLKMLNEDFHSDLIEFSASTSTAISDLVSGLARKEGVFIGILFLIFFILICLFVSFQGDIHTSVGFLSLFGICNFFLSSGTTFGLLTLMKVEILEPMALIVFVIAILDCMRSSILCGVYHRYIEEYLPSSAPNSRIDSEEILHRILRSSFSSIFSSTWILIIVYLLLAWISPIPCIEILSMTLVLYIIINTFLHGTFFSSCLVLTLKRLESYRHCLTCLPLAEDFYQKIPSNQGEKRFAKIFSLDRIYRKFLAALLCLLSVVVLLFSLWSIPSIDTRLFDDRFLPRNATSLRSYMKSQVDDYTIGPMIMFVIPSQLNYQQKSIQRAMSHLLDRCSNETTTNQFKLFWLDYENLKTLIYGRDPIPIRITPYSENDLIIHQGPNRSSIVASRFYCQFQSVKGDRDDLRTMSNLYTYANQSGLNGIFPYSLVFPHYEALGQLRLDIDHLILIFTLVTLIVSSISSRSVRNSLFISLHYLTLLASSLACLYYFHQFTINFANALWFYFLPVIYLDGYLHSVSSTSKWVRNRVLLALILSLIVFHFLPIETYLYHIIHQSLLYQSVITFFLWNISLPSWMSIFKKSNDETKKKTKKMDGPNLVCEPNGST